MSRYRVYSLDDSSAIVSEHEFETKTDTGAKRMALDVAIENGAYPDIDIEGLELGRWKPVADSNSHWFRTLSVKSKDAAPNKFLNSVYLEHIAEGENKDDESDKEDDGLIIVTPSVKVPSHVQNLMAKRVVITDKPDMPQGEVIDIVTDAHEALLRVQFDDKSVEDISPERVKVVETLIEKTELDELKEEFPAGAKVITSGGKVVEVIGHKYAATMGGVMAECIVVMWDGHERNLDPSFQRLASEREIEKDAERQRFQERSKTLGENTKMGQEDTPKPQPEPDNNSQEQTSQESESEDNDKSANQDNKWSDMDNGEIDAEIVRLRDDENMSYHKIAKALGEILVPMTIRRRYLKAKGKL